MKGSTWEGRGAKVAGHMTRRTRGWAVMSWLAVAGGAGAEERAATRSEDFGAVVAPAVLPEGGTSVAGWAGVPELGAAYRQGMDGWELGARLRFDYLRLSVSGEAVGRWRLWAQEGVTVAAEGGLGVLGSSGSDYFDTDNLKGVFLRVNPAVVATLRVAETVTGLGMVEVGYDQGLTTTRQWRVKPLVGGGAEVYLGESLSMSLVGELGADVFKGPSGRVQTRLGYGARLGLGVRLF